MSIIVSDFVKRPEKRERTYQAVGQPKTRKVHRPGKPIARVVRKKRKQRLSGVPQEQALPAIDNTSVMERIAKLSKQERKELFKDFSDTDLEAINFDWNLWKRPDQTPPPYSAWDILLIESGRGFGKTRIGSELIRDWVQNHGVKRLGLGGQTPQDIRDVMVEGESGILNVFHPGNRPHYEPSKLRITFKGGARASLFSAEKPDKARGPQNEKFWWDELAACSNVKEFFDNVMMGLRIGKLPQAVVTTTPRRTKEYRKIFHDKGSQYGKALRISRMRGSSYSNIANLARLFIDNVIKPYEGTRLGRQELWGEFLEDAMGALWSGDMLDYRVDDICLSDMVQVVVAVDPATTYNEDSASTGIVIVGLDRFGHGYVLGDWSVKAPPVTKTIGGKRVVGWADIVAKAYFFFEADVVVGETNNGGDLVEAVIANATDTYGSHHAMNFKKVTASRGKRIRAEPIALIYEKGLIHHLSCSDLEDLEDQMCNWEPGDESPDNLDAMVWGFTELFLQPGGDFFILADANNWKDILKVAA